MSFFDQIYQSVFGSRQKQDNLTLAHEVLKRSDTYTREYEKWKEAKPCAKILSSIKSAYILKQQGIEQQPEVHVLQSPYANGLAISYSSFFEALDFSYLLDLVADKVTTLGYRATNSDVIIRNRSGITETIEKRYLKPLHGTNTPLDQKFGNILIEFVKVDEKPSYFKLSANVYSDRLYSHPVPFDELISKIF